MPITVPVQASDRERLVHLESFLHERVVGQDAGALRLYTKAGGP